MNRAQTNKATTPRSGGRILNKNTLSAQCYPRHACPLRESLLMHLHEPTRTAPALALGGKNNI
ncbi:hypothetical protein AT03_01095 [Hafnia alvei FB1]|uniref:Uncharacterized protein n=1 Tax=Hafnia alvei FB1 TaxID=1453496 RepID=A0A097QXC7_HAFAL|nr:hypothetical protein AT03_01095 [Hafnia alvei FB1]